MSITLREELLNCQASFTWGFSNQFYVETPYGNFIWSDPDYMGDNSFTLTKLNYKEWCTHKNIPYGRDKGKHIIKNYCGKNIKIITSPTGETIQ